MSYLTNVKLRDLLRKYKYDKHCNEIRLWVSRRGLIDQIKKYVKNETTGPLRKGKKKTTGVKIVRPVVPKKSKPVKRQARALPKPKKKSRRELKRKSARLRQSKIKPKIIKRTPKKRVFPPPKKYKQQKIQKPESPDNLFLKRQQYKKNLLAKKAAEKKRKSEESKKQWASALKKIREERQKKRLERKKKKRNEKNTK